MSHSERALLLQPLWFSSFISCFIHWYWKWIETKRLHLHNECVKKMCLCFQSHCSSLWNCHLSDGWHAEWVEIWHQWTSQFVDRWSYFHFIIYSECQGDPAESFFVHTREVLSWDLLINTNSIMCSSSMFQRQKSPQQCGCCSLILEIESLE